MDKLFEIAKLDKAFADVGNSEVTLVELYSLVNDNKPKIIDRIQKLLPNLKIFDCHRLKAILFDLKKSGKINEMMIQEGNLNKDEIQKLNRALQNKSATKADLEEDKEELVNKEQITPNKVSKPSNYFASMDSLRAKRRKPGFTFKRREALNKIGWGKDDKQTTLDKFLVPKRRGKAEDTNFMLMDWSDSYSWMPNTSDLRNNALEPKYRSKKRIDKLMGKNTSGPVTRSRLASNDFGTEGEWSSITSLQELKRIKKSRLDHLRDQDMYLMSAWDEDSALSVQNHITRKFRKRKAVHIAHD